MSHKRKDSKTTEAVMDVQAFEAERERVCSFFAEHEDERQRGQLTNVEYLLVGVILVVTFALVLVLQ